MPNKVGRPTKRTPETEAAILSAIEDGCTREVAAQAAGITKETFYEWARDFPQFSDAIEKADAEFVRRHVAVVQRASADTWQAAAWLLERRRPAMYGRRDRVEAEVKPVAEFSSVDERIDQLIQKRLTDGRS